MLEITSNLVPVYAKRALDILENKGYEAYIVGGWVRDTIMGNPSHDVDITTNAHCEDTISIFTDAGYKVIETGVQHGTVTVVIDHKPMEITTYRTESTYSDSRHPDKVEFVDSLDEDLARRDFTVNALAYNPHVGVVDLFGGVDDIHNKIIRCVGDPDTRFSEDVLRVLRCVRFSYRLGFSIEDDTQRAANKYSTNLYKVASERIGQEIQGIINTGLMGKVLVEQQSIICEAIPELKPLVGFNQHSKYHKYDVYTHTAKVCDGVEIYSVGNATQALRWAALFHDIGKSECFTRDETGEGHFYKHPAISASMARRIMKRFAISSSITNPCIALIQEHDIPVSATRKSMLSMLRRLDKKCQGKSFELALQAICIRKADAWGKESFCLDYVYELDKMEYILRDIKRETIPYNVSDLSVSGRDVIEVLDVKPGKKIGEILNSLLKEVMSGNVGVDRHSQMMWLLELKLN